MTRLLAGIAFAAALAVSNSGVASAGGGYGSQPGYEKAQTNSAGCADHGAFGALGTTGDIHDIGINNPLSNHRAGASNWQFPSESGDTTAGINNSLCGGGNVPPPFAP